MTYTRWGKSSCPNITGTELVYTGRAGGSHTTADKGGGVNFQCMPLDPEYILDVRSGINGHAYIYMALNIIYLCVAHRGTMYPVLCAMSQPVRQP